MDDVAPVDVLGGSTYPERVAARLRRLRAHNERPGRYERDWPPREAGGRACPEPASGQPDGHAHSQPDGLAPDVRFAFVDPVSGRKLNAAETQRVLRALRGEPEPQLSPKQWRLVTDVLRTTGTRPGHSQD